MENVAVPAYDIGAPVPAENTIHPRVGEQIAVHRTSHASLEQRHAADLSRLSLTIQLGSFRCHFLAWGVIQGAWRNHVHNHSFVEVCYAYAGEGIVTVHGEQQRIAAGDLFVVRPGDVHEIASPKCGTLGVCFWAYSVERLPHPDEVTTALDRLVVAFFGSSQTCRRSTVTIDPVLELLASELDRRAPAYNHVVEALVGQLLVETCRMFADLPSEALPFDTLESATADAQICTLTRYLDENYRRQITVREVAAHLHFSERHTRRLCRHVLGISLKDYLTRQRLQLAARMLLTDDLSIKAVAARCGYLDVQYFTSLFRRYMGQPPGRFRELGGMYTLGDDPRGTASLED